MVFEGVRHSAKGALLPSQHPPGRPRTAPIVCSLVLREGFWLLEFGSLCIGMWRFFGG